VNPTILLGGKDVRSDGKIVVVAINQLEWEHGGLRRFLSYAGGRLVDTLSASKYPRIIVAAQVLHLGVEHWNRSSASLYSSCMLRRNSANSITPSKASSYEVRNDSAPVN
jgi:hypothetical protein